jgi:acyl-CoA reductase-like NAD-dependent aldehyde dehydrogenase
VTEQREGTNRGAGGPQVIPSADRTFPETPREELDAALAALAARAAAWTETDVAARIDLLGELTESVLAAAPAWVEAAAKAKGIHHDSPLMGEDWGSGIVTILRNLRLLERTLRDIQATGRPQPPALEVAPNGQVVAKVLPSDRWDALLLPGFKGEVRLEPHVTLDQATARMGRIYREGHEREPGVALVLGAGNVSSIGPMDALYELFAKDHVVLLKMNPVNEHLGPHIAEAFEPLVRAGFVRLVYGGADVGEYLTRHEQVATVHVTGSDKTHEAIVFGRGEEGARRKAAGEPELAKPVTSELGNVTPVIVVPGPWSDKDLAYHGHSLASKLVQNGGFNCVAARVIVQHRSWARRHDLLRAIRDSLRSAEERVAYYPGAVERWERFVTEHPTSEWFGDVGPDRVPFTLIPDLDPRLEDDIAFRTEAFCGVFGEVAIDAPRSVPDFLEQAVEFCNETLWGTLSASLLVHPRSLRDPEVAAAVERAIDDLRYGSVVVNDWSGQAYAMVNLSWGAYPGSPDTDIQSGRGVVHNTFLLEDVEKSVVRGPFRSPTKPLWFHTHRTLDEVLPAVARFTATGDPRALPKVVWAALRG